MAVAEALRFRTVSTDELLTEAQVLEQDYSPFLGPGDRPEPYRSYYIACARLAPVMKKEKVTTPLIVELHKKRGLLYRNWPTSLGIVFFNGNTLDEQVTYFDPSERKHMTYVFDQIVLNPPKWG